jgi:glycosyltransferase involved in cell wall biosynthesis
MTIERVVKALQNHINDIVIVDDGSDDQTAQIVDALMKENPEHIHVKHHRANCGKGAAMQTGLKLAQELGFDDALQVDADGQHDLADVPKFIALGRKTPGAMIMGAPIFDDTIPAIRKHGRKLTALMIMLESGVRNLPDGMCGFRLYPVRETNQLGTMSARMGYDPQVMIHAIWAGIPIKTVPTKVRYLSPEEGGVSHFRMVRDNILNVWVHTRLLLQAPFRLYLRMVRH